jgi:thioredoxin reductase (NADPH)
MAEHDLSAVAFPTLNEAQIEKLGSCAGALLKKYPDGQALFKVGERDFKFFVVKSGEVEIIDESGDTPKTVTVQRPEEFTGEVAQLTGSPAVVSAFARGDTEVYEISAESVRQFLNTYPELADIILQAFIARRQLLRESGNFTGLRVIGSRYSQDTFRIRDFFPGTGYCLPGLTWRPILKWANCSSASESPKPKRLWLHAQECCSCATRRIASSLKR